MRTGSAERCARAARGPKQLYRHRHKIEIMFARLKDWRRIATRYDRCAHTFMSAIALAVTVLFWLPPQ
jgi:transposase